MTCRRNVHNSTHQRRGGLVVSYVPVSVVCSCRNTFSLYRFDWSDPGYMNKFKLDPNLNQFTHWLVFVTFHVFLWVRAIFRFQLT